MDMNFSWLSSIQMFFTKLIGYETYVRFEDFFGIASAVILGHILTILICSRIHLHMRVDAK